MTFDSLNSGESAFDYFVTNLDLSRVTKFQSLLYRVIEELHSDSPWIETLKAQYSQDVLRDFATAAFATCPVIYEPSGEAIALGIGRHEGGLGTVSWMVVDSRFRGLSLGSRIMDSMLNFYRCKGCHRVELKTYLNNPLGQKFYQSKGFEYSAVLPNHKFGFDIVYMIKDLSAKIELTEGIQ